MWFQTGIKIVKCISWFPFVYYQCKCHKFYMKLEEKEKKRSGEKIECNGQRLEETPMG